MSNNIVIVYGQGHDLDFGVFAQSLKNRLLLASPKAKITIKKTFDDTAFTQFLTDWSVSEPIDELHIFSHSIGAGIYVGYGDPVVGAERNRMLSMSLARKIPLTFEEVRDTETGGILTDDLLYPPFSTNQVAYRQKFSPTAFIKIWGCNSAIAGWLYSDSDAAGAPVYDPADKTALYYYWRALNTKNIPKPSVAQAFANYFNVKVFGASSGSHIEVFHKKKWITTQQYKSLFGKYPPGTLPHRLHPDKGTYKEYTPTP